MERGRKALDSAEYLESRRVIERLRELVPKIGPVKAAEQVGCSHAYASQVHNGLRPLRKEHELGNAPIESLGLRKSDKNCRRCGNKSVLVTRTLLCVVCELLELAKQGIIHIEPENGSGDN